MPAMTPSSLIKSGMETIRRIRDEALRPDAYIIVQTAYAMFNDRTNFLNGGADDYLSKPYSLTDVRKSLERALEHLKRQPHSGEDPA